jgi:predicted GIY-YIG superfamily endonuclease
MTVYLLHFDSPISKHHTAQHYIGWTEQPLENRLEVHKQGNGARFTQVANERGIRYQIVRTWKGNRKLERKLKNRKNSPKLCPICNKA